MLWARYDRRMTDNGHVVALASRLHFEDAKSVVGVVKRDPLDRSRRRIRRGVTRLRAGLGHGF
jgi:hypothetical protein